MAGEGDLDMRGETGAPANRHAIRYYQQLWAQGGLMGQPALCNGHGFVMACPGRSSDVIHVYVWIVAGRIQEARWQCHMCDPWMQVAGDILCHLAQGSPPARVLDWTWQDFEGRLGGDSALIREHAGAAMLTLHKAVIDHQVRTCLIGRPDDQSGLEPTRKLRDLGFAGRAGQQCLRQRLEAAFAAFGLQIPPVKAQEWVALGTLQDVSLTVQSLIERQVIQRILSQGCGFPRSFEEQRPVQG
jgi:hypothetical protein